MIKIVLYLLIYLSIAYAQDVPEIFSGRISRINSSAKLLRVKVNFKNLKFLNSKDRVEFWNETYTDVRCLSFIEARTNDYLLLRVPNYDQCIKKMHMTVGSYLHFYSEDMVNNMKLSQEVVEILLKKRLALLAKKQRHEKDLDVFVEKVEAVNKRYEVLNQKLQLEWKNDIALLEEDKSRSFKDYEEAQARLNEIEGKLESYKIHDQNLTVDRWSLDPMLFYKK